MRTVAFAALVASAAAFSAPALRAPRTTGVTMAMDKSGKAPVITVFDHRGCTAHKNDQYTGPKANGMEDEQCVKVAEKRARCALLIGLPGNGKTHLAIAFGDCAVERSHYQSHD
jgi:chromosomal replication initiation ATPase DnaA